MKDESNTSGPRRGRHRGRWWALVVAGCLVTAPAGLPAAADEHDAPAAPGPEVPGVASSPYGDRDRNRVQDELDTAVASLAEGHRLTVIVLFSRPVDDSLVAELRSQLGDFTLKARWTVVDGISADLTASQVLSLARRPDVVQVEPERRFTTAMDTARHWYGVDKAVTDFGVTGDRDGSDRSYSRNDVVACVIDTGIDATHVDLDGGQVIGWRDYVLGLTTPYDDHGHGTHVAGILAGQGDGSRAYRGVAPGAALVGVKVLNAAGTGTTTAIINGVDFCVSNRAVFNIRIISMSLGSAGSSDGRDALSTAVNRAADAGVLPSVAAGNSGPDASTIGSPAAAAKALTVCSLADVGERGFFVSSFSSRGPTADGRVKPDLCAPGHNVTAPKSMSGSGYVTFSGTSMATPFASGVAALMLDANSALTPGDLKSRLMGTAEDWRSAGADIDTGRGRMQAYEAVKSAAASSGTGPAVPAHYRSNYQTLGGTGAGDDWAFNVTRVDYPVALTAIVPGAWLLKDFDVHLYAPGGALVASSRSLGRQETVTFSPAVTGTYTARVRSKQGSGSYYLDFSYGGTAPTLRVNR